MELPKTLHGQLYLLGYDSKRHRFGVTYPQLFELALHAAMLTDLYLAGYLEDRSGRPCPTRRDPEDPVLRAALERIGDTEKREWSELIAQHPKRATRVVRNQLEAGHWLCSQRHWALGIVPTTRLGPRDIDMVDRLNERVAMALHSAISGLSADPRPLALGLLGVLAQMPTVFSFEEGSRYRRELRELTVAAIEPILGLQQAIEQYHENLRAVSP